MNPLFLVSGPSGCGKSTIMHRLMDNEIISVTTRAPREREVEGKDYYFISRDEFTKMLFKGELIEHTQYSGNYYGLQRCEVEQRLERGPTFAICDVNGMRQMKDLYPHATTIFIWCDPDDAIKQMRERGDSDQAIAKRMATFNEEIKNRIHYDYVIKNRHGSLDHSIKIMEAILDLGSDQ